MRKVRMSMMDWINEQTMANITKRDIAMFHDPTVSEEKKKRLAKRMEELGGYENLPD